MLYMAIFILEGETDVKRSHRLANPLQGQPSDRAISVLAEEADCYEHISKIAHKLRSADIELKYIQKAAELWDDLAKFVADANMIDKAAQFYKRASEQRVNRIVTLKLVDLGEYYKPRMR